MDDGLVVDSKVFVAALRSAGGASREVLRICLERQCQPLIGEKLFAEYEDVLSREVLFLRSPLSASERNELLDAYLSVCEWIPVFFLWRPNLPDEGDNHIVELAIAGAATRVITHNVRDFHGGELRFPHLMIQTPSEFLKQWREHHGYDDNPNS